MNFLNSFIQYKEKKNIVPVQIPEKDLYFSDLMNIEHSWTGRMDAQLANTFMMEAVQLICNAIVLFEKGYFDCAYYSLRQSIEVATTMIYLSDIPEELRKEKLEAWKRTRDFPMQGQMLTYLKENGNLFSDLKIKLSNYFVELSKLSKKLNKIVHKQGLKYFYVSRNHPINKEEKRLEEYISDFQQYLKSCIGVVAVMRLSIDPYPVLLMDEEIYCRTFNMMTEPYTDEFVEKYVGNQVLSDYKKTEIYNTYYEYHMQAEKMLDCVTDIVKNQYINKEQMKTIITQVHLLGDWDFWAVMLVLWCDKAIKIYCCGGLMFYFTNLNTNRKVMSWDSGDFKAFSENAQKYNQQYDVAYISTFYIQNDYFFIEHNEILTEEEILRINDNIDINSNKNRI